jgi:5'-nucleotidase
MRRGTHCGAAQGTAGTMWVMTRILVTNDDGVDAPGIRHLALAAAEHGLDVVVAAPMEEASGSSAALTVAEDSGRIMVKRHGYPDLDGVDVYGVAASPAFIVLLAMHGAFGARPELVLSGINRGANAGRAVLHSGTVGAVLTFAAAGGRGMAVSLDLLPAAMAVLAGSAAEGTRDGDFDGDVDGDVDVDERRHWATAARAAMEQLAFLQEMPPGTVLNLNAPDLPYEQLRGFRRGALARFGQVQMTVVDSGEGYLQTSLAANDRVEPGSDVALLAEGFVSITPIRPPAEAPDVAVD